MLGHEVDAAQVAAICHRYSEIGNLSAKQIEQFDGPPPMGGARFSCHTPGIHRATVAWPRVEPRHRRGRGKRAQPAVYSCDLNERCRTASGASAIFRIAPQVCL
jgi:hypothetical protein